MTSSDRDVTPSFDVVDELTTNEQPTYNINDILKRNGHIRVVLPESEQRYNEKLEEQELRIGDNVQTTGDRYFEHVNRKWKQQQQLRAQTNKQTHTT